MKFPLYTRTNYKEIIEKPFSDNNNWIDIKDFLKIMTDKFIATFADANSLKIGEYVTKHSEAINSAPPISL